MNDNFQLNTAKQAEEVLKVEEIFKTAPPLSYYFICFTPRSGSSWLTEMLIKTDIAGLPEEWFNPDFLGENLKRFSCKNMNEYIQFIIRFGCSNPDNSPSVFGAEMSFFQFQLVENFLQEEKLLFSQNVNYIYLYRLNLVGQAMSLYKAVETQVFQSVDQNFHNKYDLDFIYNEEGVWEWLLHILEQEFGWRQFFNKHQIEPLIITYEEIWSETVLQVTRILQYLNLSGNISFNSESQYRKISSKKDLDFAIKFTKENFNKIQICYKYRGEKNNEEIRKLIF
jgi:LPS sulfotransferase NodH